MFLAIEMFHRDMPEGQAGEQVGTLLRGIKKNIVRRGMVVCHPQAIWSHRIIQAQVSFKTFVFLCAIFDYNLTMLFEL